MAVFLNECEAGAARDCIGFPHLLICMGVVLQTANWLYGFHFDKGTQAESDAFEEYLDGAGARVANGVRLYGCCDWSIRYQDNGKAGKALWQAEMRQIATTIGYQGEASGFNTGIISPQFGTYVEYRPDFNQEKCRIYYKRDEKMTYTKTARTSLPSQPGGNFFAFKSGQNNDLAPKTPKPKSPMFETSGASIVTTDKNQGRLHELNYFLRLYSFTI